MTATTTKRRKKSALATHLDQECGCSPTKNPNNCIYQEFLDGWSFTPDVGNGQKRGEVFTPRFIIDKMITDSGIIPREGVYDQAYTTTPRDRAEHVVSAENIELAVGTGNFISTIMWHKIQYAYYISLRDDHQLDLAQYHRNLLTAVASVYAFDIDPGNVEVSRRRMLASHTPLNDGDTIAAWQTEVREGLSTSGHDDLIERYVAESLDSAQEHWSKFFNDAVGGVIQQLYRTHTGTELPETLYTLCRQVVTANIKQFNGIVREDTITEDMAVPGWDMVEWDWWTVSERDGELTLESKKVSLAHQRLAGEIEELQRKSKRLRDEKLVEKMDGLFPVEDWETEKDKAEYNKLLRTIAAVEKDLENVIAR